MFKKILLILFFVFVVTNINLLEAEEKKLKIIVLSGYHEEVITALDAEEYIIGYAKDYLTYEEETEKFSRLSAFNFLKNKDLTAIYNAKPNWVFISMYDYVAHKNLINEIEEHGIKVYTRHITNPNEIYNYWREIAEIVGRADKAEELIKNFEKRLEPYYKASLERKDAPGVFVESHYTEIKTFTPSSIAMWVVRMAGGRNVATDAKPDCPNTFIAAYGPERLRNKAQEIDIFLSSDFYEVDLETLKARKSYQMLKAFQDDKVFKINNLNIWQATPSLIDAIEQIAKWTELEVDVEAEAEAEIESPSVIESPNSSVLE